MPRTFAGAFKSSPAAIVLRSRAHRGVQGGRGRGARDLNPKSRSASDPLFACPNAVWAGRARRSMRLKRAPASLPGLQVRSIVRPRDCSPRRSDFYPKAQITQMAVQKMQVVVQKMQVKQSFSFVLLLKQATNVRRRETAMKRCALCHGRLGLGARFRNIWNGRWWVHVRLCSVW